MGKNKKILVIKPYYEHVPIGIAYVLGVLEKEGYPYDFHDMCVDSKTDFRDVLSSGEYSAIATGGLVGDFKEIRKIAVESKKISPKMPFILGGGITHDISPNLLFEMLPIDYAVLGEAETSLPGLLKSIIEKDRDINECDGLIFKSPYDGKIFRKAPKRVDLEQNDPLPSYKKIDINFYLDNWEHQNWGKKRSMPILTGRGCRGMCGFCSPTIGRFKKRKYENVLAEIEFYNRLYDPNAFMFINEIIYESSDQIIEFCQYYKKLTEVKPWMCLLRADIDPEVFPAMEDAGCTAINIGIESGSDKILKRMKKAVDREHIISVIRALQKSRLVVEYSAMLAYEGETEDELKATIDLFIDEGIIYHTLGLTFTYPGTRIYKNALKRGQIKDEKEYIENLVYGMQPSNADLSKENYLNISGIPDEIFLEKIYTQYRRYAHFLYKTCSAENINIDIDHDNDLVKFSGTCPKCGCHLNVEDIYSENFLNTKTKCPECDITVYFNPFEMEEYGEHYYHLVKSVRNADRIIINGTNGNAYALFIYDILNIPPEKIIAFIGNPKHSSDDKFFHYPKIETKMINKISPSVILNARYPRDGRYLNIYTD